MGTSYGISCKECDYSKNFIIGTGMMYGPVNLMDFDSEFPLLQQLIRSKKAISNIKQLLNEKNATITEGYGHAIYRCPKCGEFYERFFIHLDYEEGCYEVEYRCIHCKAILKSLLHDERIFEDEALEEIPLEKYPCPKCGKYSLYQNKEREILWD